MDSVLPAQCLRDGCIQWRQIPGGEGCKEWRGGGLASVESLNRGGHPIWRLVLKDNYWWGGDGIHTVGIFLLPGHQPKSAQRLQKLLKYVTGVSLGLGLGWMSNPIIWAIAGQNGEINFGALLHHLEWMLVIFIWWLVYLKTDIFWHCKTIFVISYLLFNLDWCPANGKTVLSF